MKAIGLLSGGLDSTLAVQLMVDQGIEVIAVKFTSLFCQCDGSGCCHAAQVAERLGIPLKRIPKGDDYLRMLRDPPHGRGTNMNPCIDCRIYMLRMAKTYMEEVGAAFLFTGEVLGQRPMSQHRQAMELIAREAGVEGRLLRPLCASHFAPTEAETRGWVDRARLLDITGRSRKPQLAMAAERGIQDFSCPAGGCLLTDPRFSMRMRDLFAHQAEVVARDIALLKAGRHFRVGGSKIVCGRDQGENGLLQRMRAPGEWLFEATDRMGPVVLLQGEADEVAVQFAADVVTAYADGPAEPVVVRAQSPDGERTMRVQKADRERLHQNLV